MAELCTLDELLQTHRSKKSSAESASTEANTALTELRNRLIAGETTGDRNLDFAIVFEGVPDPEKGKGFSELEQRFQAHPAEAALIVASWEEDLIKYCIGHPGQHIPTTIEYAYILGIISQEPVLSWSEYGRLQLPILRAMVVDLRDASVKYPVREFQNAEVAPFELHREIRFGLGRLPGEEDLIIGTEQVTTQLLEGLPGGATLRYLKEDGRQLWISNHFAALGLETFDQEGQGRLGMPGEVEPVR